MNKKMHDAAVNIGKLINYVIELEKENGNLNRRVKSYADNENEILLTRQANTKIKKEFNQLRVRCKRLESEINRKNREIDKKTDAMNELIKRVNKLNNKIEALSLRLAEVLESKAKDINYKDVEVEISQLKQHRKPKPRKTIDKIPYNWDRDCLYFEKCKKSGNHKCHICAITGKYYFEEGDEKNGR